MPKQQQSQLEGCLSPVRASAVAADNTGALTLQGLPRPDGSGKRILYNPNADKIVPPPQAFIPYTVTDAGNCSPRFVRPAVSVCVYVCVSSMYVCMCVCTYACHVCAGYHMRFVTCNQKHHV